MFYSLSFMFVWGFCVSAIIGVGVELPSLLDSFSHDWRKATPKCWDLPSYNSHGYYKVVRLCVNRYGFVCPSVSISIWLALLTNNIIEQDKSNSSNNRNV